MNWLIDGQLYKVKWSQLFIKKEEWRRGFMLTRSMSWSGVAYRFWGSLSMEFHKRSCHSPFLFSSSSYAPFRKTKLLWASWHRCWASHYQHLAKRLTQNHIHETISSVPEGYHGSGICGQPVINDAALLKYNPEQINTLLFFYIDSQKPIG